MKNLSLVAILLSVFWSFAFSQMGAAHQAHSGWDYYRPCCGEKDCRQVEDDQVEQIFEGESFFNLDGEEIIVEEPGFIVRGRYIPYHRAMISLDEHYHICTRTGPNASDWSKVYSAHDLRLAGEKAPNFQFCRHFDLDDATQFESQVRFNQGWSAEGPSRNLGSPQPPSGFVDLIDELERAEQSISFDRDFHCIWVPRQACNEALGDSRRRERPINLQPIIHEVIQKAPVHQRLWLQGLGGSGGRRPLFSPRDPDEPIIDLPVEPPTDGPPSGAPVAPVFLSGAGVYYGGMMGAVVVGLIVGGPTGWAIGGLILVASIGASSLF